MSQTITINLPDETRNALDQAAGEEGLSESELIEKGSAGILPANEREARLPQRKSQQALLATTQRPLPTYYLLSAVC